MVHALEIIRDCLDPEAGLLIDIHPLAIPRILSVQAHGERWEAGHLVDADDFDKYRAADRALAEANQRGFFVRQGRHRFGFLVHFETLDDLLDYLREGDPVGDKAEYWPLELAVAERVKELVLTPGPQREIVLREPVCMTAFSCERSD